MAQDNNTFVIEATWDNEAEVWVAESDSVPGFITEAEVNNHPVDPDKQLDITLRFHR